MRLHSFCFATDPAASVSGGYVSLSLDTLPYILVRGGWTHFKCCLNVLLIIAFFCLVFHMILNSRNTKLKIYGFVRY